MLKRCLSYHFANTAAPASYQDDFILHTEKALDIEVGHDRFEIGGGDGQEQLEFRRGLSFRFIYGLL